MDSPSQKLADRIVGRLVEEKLISPEAGKKNVLRLADGKLKPEDWRFLVELAGNKELKL